MTLVLVAIGLSLAMAAAWWWQRRVSNIGWVDVFWTFATAGGGCALVFAWASGEGSWPRRLLVTAMIAVWAVRLGLYVAFRVAGAPEDGRYVEIRQQWGDGLQGKMFGFLQLQAGVSLVLAAAIGVAANRPAPGLQLSDLAGVLIAMVAIAGEALADQQVKAFRRDPANKRKVCDVGLWAWSRHPNYFFEWLGWLAYPVMAIDLTGAWPQGWLALAAPVVMFAVLRFGTGVPPLEAHMLRTRGALFSAYQARVSAFIPLPPKTEGEVHEPG
jgi:steroid 5-alpha reductase family enzyme